VGLSFCLGRFAISFADTEKIRALNVIVYQEEDRVCFSIVSFKKIEINE